eukprot:m.71468 g.71468  ORF g.71468 m.71468 type:complete len:703 (-) comp8350_c0_seq1:1855-3963(-)
MSEKSSKKIGFATSASTANNNNDGDSQEKTESTSNMQITPTVESNDQEDRLRARRIRIKARVDAEKRKEQGLEDLSGKEQHAFNLNPTPEQSNERISEALQDLDTTREQGMEKVTLVRITSDFAEAKRRREEMAARDERRKQLIELREDTVEMFKSVNKKWGELMRKKDVVDLDASLQKQKEECDTILSRKEEMIASLQAQLKSKDDEYVRNLRAEAADVDTILAYMDDQIQSLQQEYRKELELIEDVFMQEREELLKETRTQWEEAIESRRQKELLAIQISKQQIELQEKQLEHLRIADSEEYNMIKKKLESDIMQMHQELQNMRATYQLNTEKLEYNYQVLRKRDEENTVTVSSQKRRINKLQDSVNSLRSKLEKQEETIHNENVILTEEYKRVVTQLSDHQTKAKHFETLDRKRLDEVWELNEEKCTAKSKELLNADRVIHEQQLGLQWVPPLDIVFDSSVSDQEIVSRKASAVARELLNNEEYDDVNEGHLSSSTLRHALTHICNEAGFLVESKLEKLLHPLNEKEQHLVKLDAIFKALQVETEDDMKKLVSYFVVPSENPENSSSGEPEFLDATKVPAALRRFVEDQRKAKGLDESLKPVRGLKKRNPHFFDRLVDLVPDEHDKAYSALIDGLEKYHKALVERENAVKKRNQLEQQNAELRTLLQTYLSSQANNDLVIPPSTVITHQQMQLTQQGRY